MCISPSLVLLWCFCILSFAVGVAVNRARLCGRAGGANDWFARVVVVAVISAEWSAFTGTTLSI